jgi:hypothetical protein
MTDLMDIAENDVAAKDHGFVLRRDLAFVPTDKQLGTEGYAN